MTIYAYKIEGFGDQETGDLFRISTGIPALVDDKERELYIDALEMDSVMPRTESVDWSKSKTSFTTTNFSIVTSAGLPDRMRYFWLRTDANPGGAITSDMTPIQNGIPIAESGLDETVIYVGREAIKLGTHNGSVYTASTRGYFGTIQQAHSAGIAYYTTMHPVTFRGRRITFMEIEEDRGMISSEVDIFSYTLEDITWSGFNAMRFQCSSSMQTLLDSKPAVRFATGQVDYYFANTQDAGIRLDIDPDTSTQIPLANPSSPVFMCGGGDYVYAGTVSPSGIFVLIPRFEPLYNVNVPEWDDMIGAAFEVLTSLPFTNSLGYEGSEYYGDIITILLNIFTSTPNGNNGPFDIGIDCGIRHAAEFWDFDACRNLRAALGNEISAPLFIMRPATSIQEALKEAEKMLQAHQIGIVHTAIGKLGFTRPFDSGTVYQDVADIDLDAILYEDKGDVAGVSSRLQLQNIVTQVQVKYNESPGIKPSTVTINDADFDNLTMGRAGKVRLDMGVQSSLDIAFTVGYNWSFRWRGIVPTTKFKTTRSHRLPVGSSILLSHPNIPTWVAERNYLAAGGKRIAAVISSRRERRDAFEYEAHLVGLRFDRTAPRAPAMQVMSYNAPDTIFVELQEYVTPNHPAYTNDTDAFSDGDVVQFLQSSGVQRTATTAAIVVEDTNEISLTGITTDLGIQPGDIIVFAPYADVTGDQQARGTFTASSDGTVGGDRGYQWQG